MGGACSTHGEMYAGFWWGDLRDGDHLEDPGVDVRVILKWIFRKWMRDMDWTDLAQDRDRWRALVCVNEHSGSIKHGKFLDYVRTG